MQHLYSIREEIKLMKKDQTMLTCSGIMLVLQSIAYYLVWHRIDSDNSDSMTGFCIAYIVTLFMLFPLLGALIVLNFGLILLEAIIVSLDIVVAIVDKRKE